MPSTAGFPVAHTGQLGVDTAVALANRLGRDELWDTEIRRQAVKTGLPVIDVDGTRDADAIAADLATCFRL